MNSEKINILIIYASQDDIASSRDSLGWVSYFKKILGMIFRYISSTSINIIAKNETETWSSHDIDGVTFVLIVLSKDFLDNKKCIEMLNRLNDKSTSNIAQIIKFPLHKYPSFIKNCTRYHIYHKDKISSDTEEYNVAEKDTIKGEYMLKMTQMAYDIKEHFDRLTLAGHQNNQTKGKNRTVFLAETTHDILIERNLIKRELIQQGYSILPTTPLPYEEEELEKTIKKCLKEADLSIHIIGQTYGSPSDAAQKLVVDMQSQLSTVEASGRLGDFPRFIWISTKQNNANVEQKNFIESAKRNFGESEDIEMLQGAFEEFKSIIRKQLDKQNHKIVKNSTVSKNKSVYLLYDKIDEKHITPYVKLIKKAGLELIVPLFDVDFTTARNDHIKNLQIFDYAIIFQKNVGARWVQMKILDILKAPSLNREKAILGKIVLSPIENQSDHEDININPAFEQIIGNEKSCIATMQQFLNHL